VVDIRLATHVPPFWQTPRHIVLGVTTLAVMVVVDIYPPPAVVYITITVENGPGFAAGKSKKKKKSKWINTQGKKTKKVGLTRDIEAIGGVGGGDIVGALDERALGVDFDTHLANGGRICGGQQNV